MKRIITLLLATILALGCLNIPVCASDPSSEYDGTYEVNTRIKVTLKSRISNQYTLKSSDSEFVALEYGGYSMMVSSGGTEYTHCYYITISKVGVYLLEFEQEYTSVVKEFVVNIVEDDGIDESVPTESPTNPTEDTDSNEQAQETKPTNPSEPTEDSALQKLGMAPIGALGYQEMTSSQELLDLIKVIEGFAAKPFWDYAQYTIGYGCNADQPEGFIEEITPEEAEALLKRELKESYEKYVNNYCRKIGKQPSQNQFDALVSFTYNVGTAWMSGSRVDIWLRNPSTEMEFVNAIGQWSRAGNDLLFGLAQRRIREAIIFLKGEYSLPYAPTKDHNVKSNLRVISPGALPYYASVIYQYDYDTDSVKKGGGNAIAYFPIGGNYDSLRIPTRDGYMFSGWKTTRINGNKTTIGGMVDASTVVEKNLELTALWTEIIIEETQPENPDETIPDEENKEPVPEESKPEESVPEETKPEESVPETTEPEESVPETSEPDVTEPEETEPEETKPEETEPEETEPEETEPEEESDKKEFVFTDVGESAWFREAVEFVYDNGYMNGISQTKFNPQGTMSRAMLVTVLYRMDNEPAVKEEQRNTFEDVGADLYYTDAVAWARANGIVNGISQTEFAPNRNVTRQEAVAILYRFCVEYCGLSGVEAEELDQFLDAKEVAAYAVDPMRWAVAVGLINGTTSTDGLCLNPLHNLSRCENAAILMRCVKEILS